MRFDKRFGFLAFAVGLWLWMGYSIISHSAKKIIKTTIIQSATPLHHLDDPIKIRKKEILWIDKLYFPKGNELRHPTYGYLGYRQNFLILFDSDFVLEKDKRVKFTIYSDDGFRLKIDGKRVMEYTSDRPFRKSEASIILPAGKHHLFIKYFQGYGQLGIVGYYQVGSAKPHLIGKSSEELRFVEK